MLEEKIKKIIEDNDIPEDSEFKSMGLNDLAAIILDILKEYTSALVDNLNSQKNELSKKKPKEESELLGLTVGLFNAMLNAAVPEALDKIMKNLPKFLGIEADIDDVYEELSECDGEA